MQILTTAVLSSISRYASHIPLPCTIYPRSQQSVVRFTAAMAATFVYLLQSLQDPRKTYIGVTNDISRRIRQHNGEIVGGARYTRRFRPWKFYALFRLRTRTHALQLEYRAKHRRALKSESGIAGKARKILRLAAEFPGAQRVL